MNRETNEEFIDQHLVGSAWGPSPLTPNLTKRELNDCQRKPITDRVRELNLSAGNLSSFNLNRKSSSYDSLTISGMSHCQDELIEQSMSHNHNNSRLIADQTVPDIIADIPKSIMTHPMTHPMTNPIVDIVEDEQEVYRHPSPPTHATKQNYQITNQSESAIAENNQNNTNLFQQRISSNNPFSLNETGTKRNRKPLTGKQETVFWRSSVKSQSFRARTRPSTARITNDPFRTTADSIRNRGVTSGPYLFPSGAPATTGSSKIGTNSSPQFSLTQSTKLMQQYKSTKVTTSASTSGSTSLVSTPRKKRNRRNRSNSRESRKSNDDQLGPDTNSDTDDVITRPDIEKENRNFSRNNIPVRSQSFRRESDCDRVNNSFEVAICGSYRSVSHQDLKNSSESRDQTKIESRDQKPLWKTPSIEHIDRIRRLNTNQTTQSQHLKSAILGRVTPKAILRHPISPGSESRRPRQPRPGPLFGTSESSNTAKGDGRKCHMTLDSEPDLLSISSNEDQDFIRFKNYNNYITSGMDESELEPPPSYQEVIKDRKYIKPGKPEAQSSPRDQDYFIRSNHVTDRITSGQHFRSRVNPIRPTRDRIQKSSDDVISSSSDVIKCGIESRDIPYIDEVPSTPQLPNPSHVTNRGGGSGDTQSRDQSVPLRQKNRQTVREHRNSYISAVSSAKAERFYASLDSIRSDQIVTHHDSSVTSPTSSPIPQIDRAGSMDSVLIGTPRDKSRDAKDRTKNQRRAESNDRIPRETYRKSYNDATSPKQRGRSADKKNTTLRRRPSLNKQLRKKLESMITSSSSTQKNNFDPDQTPQRIRNFSNQKPILASELVIKTKARGSWNSSYVILYSDYLYIWKDKDIYKNQIHLIQQTNIKYNSQQTDLSGLIVEVKLSSCLCDVDYSAKKKNVFKITTTQKNEIYFACDSTEELKRWSSKISEINQSTLNINLIKQLTEKSIKKRSINPAQKSPNIPRQRLKNRATFGVKLELCPLCDFGVPLVVVLCCEVIEARLDQDGTGIYRRNGNKPIVDQLEEEMNKNIEIFTKDHELMKGNVD
jgi:hypothetical protein